jgi:hypothetical protein
VPRRFFLCTLVVLSLCTLLNAADKTELLPAGLLLTCTVDEPHLSSKTAQVGDPILCHLGTTTTLGRQAFPRGSYLTGRLDDYRDPGHFYGKGWLSIQFDRLVLPGQGEVSLAAKVVSVPRYKVDREGKIDGKGHAKRDTVEWMIPVLWPIKVLTLPGRGPYPTLKGETRITMRLMEDIILPAPATNASLRPVPMPPWARPSSTLRAPADDNQLRLVNAIASSPHYVPRRPIVRREPVADVGTVTTVIVMKDHSAYIARQYWLDNDQVLGIAADGSTRGIPIAEVDFTETVRLNRERNIPFALVPRPDPVETLEQ